MASKMRSIHSLKARNGNEIDLISLTDADFPETCLNYKCVDLMISEDVFLTFCHFDWGSFSTLLLFLVS